jgi:hypothetical protein
MSSSVSFLCLEEIICELAYLLSKDIHLAPIIQGPSQIILLLFKESSLFG